MTCVPITIVGVGVPALERGRDGAGEAGGEVVMELDKDELSCAMLSK